MNQPHCQNKRRFNTYRTLDRIEDSRPVVVIPAFGENYAPLSVDAVTRNYQTQYDSFKDVLGYAPEPLSEESEAANEFMAEWFKRRFGREPIPIEELM